MMKKPRWDGNLELIMNYLDDRADHLVATDFEEEVRSHAYGRAMRDLLQANEQARARQHS